LRRAVESATILADCWGVTARREDLLIEVNAGIFENRPDAERLEWKEQNRSRYYPSGESRSDVDGRVSSLLGKLRAGPPEEHVLLVTHGGLLFHLLHGVFGRVDWQEYCEAYSNGRRIFELKNYESPLLSSTTPIR
jgi:broad specificity phosphatase PhoE